jgi:diguanylate cyclase (GGDEF)-like protein
LTTSPGAVAHQVDGTQGGRIALARWVAVALTLLAALTASPSPVGSPAVPGVLLALVALYNIPATVASRWRFVAARRIVVAACVADVLVACVLVVLGSNDAQGQAFLILVPALVECAVLARWRGVLPAGAVALAAIGAAAVLGATRFGQVIGAGDVSLRLLTVVMVSMLAAWFASEAHRQRVTLIDNATTDPLTGTRNRRALTAALGSLPRVPFAVVAIDVDNLKPINDEYGHEAGDTVLRTVARVISEIARSGDIIARVGGDEFAVVLLALDAGEAMAVGERMRAAMHGAAIPRGRVRVSVGVAVGAPGTSALAVWHEADAALLEAKRSGGDRVADTPGLNVLLAQPPRVTAIIERIIASRDIDIVFQPVVSLRTGEVVGYEALARPPNWTQQSVEPLFRAAHHLGLARDLDWVCRRAAFDALVRLPPRSVVFLNVTVAAFLDPVHDVDQMLLVLAAAHVEPAQVVLELTERDRIGDLGRLRQVIAAYREHGFRIALDDIGEGHSSLEVLAAAVPDFLKVARSLAVADSRGARAAIEAAVAFAGATCSAVIAEGIETAAMAVTLADLGVGYGQGNWLAPPTADVGEITVRGRVVPALPAASDENPVSPAAQLGA